MGVGGVDEMRAQSGRELRGLLKGFADLVFEHGGRYWVLDYKGNHLGPDTASYGPAALRRAMAAHRYDVQAALYLLALHRLLQSRLGAAYDPYGPAELKYRLTQRALAVLLAARQPACIVTASALLLRDLPLLAEVADGAGLQVVVTLCSLDEAIWRHVEPEAGTPAARLTAIERLSAAGVPVLGVCLGHQCIGRLYGGEVVRADEVMHGKTSEILHEGLGVFEGLPSPLTATRYHSLVVRRDSVPDCLEITAEVADGTVMGLRHRDLPVEGVQFHPESILTEGGHRLIENFLDRAR